MSYFFSLFTSKSSLLISLLIGCNNFEIFCYKNLANFKKNKNKNKKISLSQNLFTALLSIDVAVIWCFVILLFFICLNQANSWDYFCLVNKMKLIKLRS